VPTLGALGPSSFSPDSPAAFKEDAGTEPQVGRANAGFAGHFLPMGHAACDTPRKAPAQPLVNDLWPILCRNAAPASAALDEAVSMTDQAIADDLPESSEQEEAVAAPRFGRKKLILFVAAPVLAILLIAAGLYFTGFLNRFIGEKSEAHEEKAAPKQTVFYDLQELLVNLSGAGRKPSFLKMSISLELENQADVARLQSVMPRIIDNFQVYLRELRVEDLRGSAGMYRLREELLLRVNAAAAPARIVDVLFKEMLVQ